MTIRLTAELLDWLKEESRKTDLPMGRMVREQIEIAKAMKGNQRFLRHAGAITDRPSDGSSRKGFRAHERSLMPVSLLPWPPPNLSRTV
jgi:hypothetical protein